MLRDGAGLIAVVAFVGCAVVPVRRLRRARALRRRAAVVLKDTGAASAGAGLWRWCAGRMVAGEAGRRWRLGRRCEVGAEVWSLPAGVALGVLGRSVLPVVASVAALFVVRRWLVGRARQRAADRRAAAVIGFCAAVAGELRAGRQPHLALVTAGAAGLGEAGPRWWRPRGTAGTSPPRCGRRRGSRAPRG
ncbi:hypothetical protein DC74_4501 [Streptomyces noursei]|nr:hypothetical protein DC74_4501 [Streptomyces noursei]